MRHIYNYNRCETYNLIQSFYIFHRDLQKALKSAGYIFALAALTLSSLGTIFTKMMTGSFEKFVILCYLGVGISTAAILQLLFFPSNVPMLPNNVNVWTQAVLIASFGTFQQFLLVCK